MRSQSRPLAKSTQSWILTHVRDSPRRGRRRSWHNHVLLSVWLMARRNCHGFLSSRLVIARPWHLCQAGHLPTRPHPSHSPIVDASTTGTRPWLHSASEPPTVDNRMGPSVSRAGRSSVLYCTVPTQVCQSPPTQPRPNKTARARANTTPSASQ